MDRTVAKGPTAHKQGKCEVGRHRRRENEKGQEVGVKGTNLCSRYRSVTEIPAGETTVTTRFLSR
jgi:hypothetical protein